MDEIQSTAVVLHFRDGRTEREASTPEIDLDGQCVIAGGLEVPFDELKAVFFRREPGSADLQKPAGGSLVSVEFADGEVIRGVAHDYKPVAAGFFLVPLEESRLERVFVVSSAVVSIEVEKL